MILTGQVGLICSFFYIILMVYILFFSVVLILVEVLNKCSCGYRAPMVCENIIDDNSLSRNVTKEEICLNNVYTIYQKFHIHMYLDI